MACNDKKGFALMLVLGMTVIFLLLGGTTAYLVFRSQQMSSGQLKYSAAIDASDAGQDMAAAWIRNAAENSVALGDSTGISVGSYSVSVFNQLLITAIVPGGSAETNSAYEGRGYGAGSGGASQYYRVMSLASVASGYTPEVCRLETFRRKLVGGE
jgi:hypothetical protein